MLKEYREKHRKLAEDYKALMAGIKAEKRERLTDDERQKIEVMNADLTALEELIAAAQRAELLDKDLSESAGRKSDGPAALSAGSRLSQGEAQTANDRSLALRGWLLEQAEKEVPAESLEAYARLGLKEGRDSFHIPLQFRAAISDATVTTSAEMPKGVGPAVERALKQFGPVRNVVHEFTTENGNPFVFLTGDDTTNAASIVGETVDSTILKPSFDKVVFGAFRYTSGLIVVSSEMLEDTPFDIETYIGEIIGERIGRKSNSDFTVGGGTTLPVGIETCETGATGATAAIKAQVTYAKLLDLYHSVDPAYRDNSRWMFNDTFLRYVRELEDENENLIWQPSAADGAPATLLGRPYTVNQSMSAHAPTKALALFGDLTKYKVRNVRGLTLKRDTSRFVEHDATVFVGFARFDGKPVDPGKAIKKFVAGSLS